MRDEALKAGRSAHGLALAGGRWDIAQAALEELLLAQVTWWLFDDALQTARAGLDAGRRAGPLVEAAFLQVRCALWYLLERFDQAGVELQAATRTASETVVRHQASGGVPMHPLPLLQFACYYATGKIAVARRELDQALDAQRKAAALTNIAKLPRHHEALSLLRIESLLQRNGPGDGEAAHELTTRLDEATLAQGTIGWSDCVELARACVAARLHMPTAVSLLHRTLNVIEENAHRAPLDADHAFARLAQAASEIGDTAVANRGWARSKYFRSRRLAAAGAAWGGEGQRA
jgi:hypothetical protein